MISLLRNYNYLIFLFFSLSCSNHHPNLDLAPIFSDHMVLQQKSEVPIWGKASPGEMITLNSSWKSNLKVKTGSDGKWIAYLKTPVYGGPHTLIISSSSEEIVVNDVMIGEVWLTSGQSNMEWPMSARILDQKKEIKNANYPDIRMFSVPRNLNGTNINSASWKITNSENATDFSAVGYFFAREIYQKLGVPVGIVNSSWGGTRVEAWTSIEKLDNLPSSKKEANLIINKGGLSAIKIIEQEYNSGIRKANEKFLEAKSYNIPDNILDWKNLNLDDIEFSSAEFDDSQWNIFLDKEDEGYDINTDNETFFTFENTFKAKTFAEDGVLWLRKRFNVDDPTKNYKFIAEKGIDDFDFTYINGKLIGKGFSCCTARSYDIPQNLLKKGENILAIRIIDTGGEGAFRGAVYLEDGDNRLYLDKGEWSFKHLAFYLASSIQKHNLSLDQLLKEDDYLKSNIKTGISTQNPNTYSILYSTMIEPVLPYKIKGFLWYQGESNVSNYQEYQSLFSGMIIDWREKWGEKLPFYFVQIAPFKYTDKAESQGLRDAQRKTLELEKTGMVVTLDIGEEEDIHPENKQDVGKRLARLALSNDYGITDILPTGPLYLSQKLYKSYIDIYFDYVGSGLFGMNNLKGFEIAGDNDQFYSAKAKIIGTRVRVSSKRVLNPKRVRYGWKNYFEATLFNKDSLPASSFLSP